MRHYSPLSLAIFAILSAQSLSAQETKPNEADSEPSVVLDALEATVSGGNTTLAVAQTKASDMTVSREK